MTILINGREAERDGRFTHVQASASATWSVNHGLGEQFLAIAIVDDTNDTFIRPDSISFDDSDNLTVNFNTAKSGYAVCIAKVSDSYTHIQGSSSATWTVTHNLGVQYVSVTVIDSTDNVVEPDTIVYDSVDQLTITVDPAIAGKAFIAG